MKLIYLGKYNGTEILSGPEKVAKRLYEHLPSSVDASFVDYFHDWNNFGIWYKLFGNRKYVNNDKTVRQMGIFPLLFMLLKDQPDIIHIITFEKFALISFIYRLFFSTKIVYSAHGVIKYETKYLRKNPNWIRNIFDSLTEKIYLTYSNKIVLPSNISQQVISKHYDVNTEKVEIIPNGVDELFLEKRILSKSNDNLNLLFIGELNREEKGIDFLRRFIDITSLKINLFIISDVAEKNMLIYNKNVNVSIFNKTETKKYKKIIDKCDIYLSLSFYESFSISTAECMASGLVCILTDDTGISEFVVNGESGYIIKFGDVSELSIILSKLHKDREILRNISAKGRSAVMDLTWGIVTKRYVNFYESINS